MGQKKRLQPKLEPYDWAEAKSKVGQRQGRRICHLPLSIGSGRRIDPQLGVAIRGPREEEFGARLSDVLCMNSTGLVGNPDTDMSAMHFCMGAEGSANAQALGGGSGRVFWGGPGAGKKKRASPEGRAKPLEGRAEARRRERSAVQGREEKHPRCDVLHIWARCSFANQAADMSGMRRVHVASNS